MRFTPILGAVMALTAAAAHAGSGSVYVDAASNIYAAGAANTAAFSSGGILPMALDVLGSTSIQFTSVGAGPVVTGSPTGGATCVFNGAASSGDGATCVSSVSNIAAAAGYSSFYLNGRSMSLVGLFVGDTLGATPAGFSATFAAANAETSFSPLLQQVFFIGDGLSDGGVLQTFAVPTGATMLYLGFADAFGFSGTPGAYGDNYGGLNVSYATAPVPEPATVALTLAGALTLVAVGRARSTRA